MWPWEAWNNAKALTSTIKYYSTTWEGLLNALNVLSISAAEGRYVFIHLLFFKAWISKIMMKCFRHRWGGNTLHIKKTKNKKKAAVNAVLIAPWCCCAYLCFFYCVQGINVMLPNTVSSFHVTKKNKKSRGVRWHVITASLIWEHVVQKTEIHYL